MRTRRSSIAFLLCLSGIVLLSGCLDVTTTSEVHRDGSITRTIVFTGDSAEISRGNFPVVLDSSWSRSITRSTGKDKNFVLTASRVFRNVDAMNDALGGTPGKTLQFRFNLDRSFRWFFTTYRYEEVNLPFEQFTTVPVTEFLSQSEIAWVTGFMTGTIDQKKGLATRGDSLAVEGIYNRLQEYALRNRFEPVFAAFRDGVSALNDTALTVAAVSSFKDSLFRSSRKALDQNNVDTLRFVFRRVLRTSLADKAWQASAQQIAEIKRKMEFESTTNSHTYNSTVVMPGLIIATNASNVEGNTATWKDFKDQSHYLGYTMWVESRHVNWWAVVLASVVVVALLGLLIASLFRKRRVS